MPRAPVAMLGGAIGLVLFAGCETVEDVRGIERTTNRVRSPSTATTIGTSRCVCQAIGTRRASTPAMKNTSWSGRGEDDGRRMYTNDDGVRLEISDEGAYLRVPGAADFRDCERS